MPEFFVSVRRERVVTGQDFDPAQTTCAFAHTSGFNPSADFASSVEDRLTKGALRDLGQGNKPHTWHDPGVPRRASLGYPYGHVLAANQIAHF